MIYDGLIIIRGGGDLATGTIYRLWKSGFRLLVLETENPAAIRRAVAVSEAVFQGTAQVEDMTAVLIRTAEEAGRVIDAGQIPVLADPKGECISRLRPAAVIDAILAKRNLGTHRGMAPLTVALGPGFTAGEDVDYVVETKRGHQLGRIIREGQAIPNTGIPGLIGGYGAERVIHAPASGTLRAIRRIGDLVTVGECSGVTLEEAKKYGNLEGTELSMCFQFEHMGVDSDPVTGKWTTKKLELPKLKEVLTRWEKGLEGIAWNSLFWDNHDQPRIVSRWGCDAPEYRERSAKMLAICLHMMKGTPYIYQGEEIGMTNYPWKDVSEFQDIDSVNNYKEIVKKGIMTPEDAFRALKAKSRDNARTPMQWDAGKNAGFSDGTPWMAVNPNYTAVNAEEALARKDSVFYTYQKLIALRKQMDVIVYGDYNLLLPEDENLWVYTRTLGEEKLLVVCNFSGKTVSFDVPEAFAAGEALIENYDTAGEGLSCIPPYGAYVLKA